MTRVVVADAGPIQYLLLSEAIEVLPVLFENVAIPPAVFGELTAGATPYQVRNWISKPPPWLTVEGGAGAKWRFPLDVGESQAIALALDIGAPLVLMDDRRGSLAAAELGLRTMGTLGVIKIAAEKGLLDLRSTVVKLQKTNMYLSPSLVEWTLNSEKPI